MRRLSAALSLVIGCGRVGFDLCASGCGGNGSGATGIERVAVASPGTVNADHVDAPFQMTSGEVVIAAHYTGLDLGPVIDNLGHTWNPLPSVVGNCASGINLRLFWTVPTNDALAVVRATGSAINARGLFVVSYRGAATPLPIDVAASNNTPFGEGGTSFQAGTLETNDNDQIVAVFTSRGGSTIVPAPGMRQLAHDSTFQALMADMPGPAGTYMPSAMAAVGAECWAGTAVALLPR